MIRGLMADNSDTVTSPRRGIPSRILLDCAFVAAMLVLFLWLSLSRLVAQDEGFYLFAAKLVARGELPYMDFFYPQMPLLPYVYGAWMKIAGESWYSARALSALFVSGTGLLLYLHIGRTMGRASAVIGCAVFATSSMVLAECTTAKTYAFSLFFTTWAFVALDRGAEELSRWRLAGAGFLFGLAVSSRAPLAIALPAFAAHVAIASTAGRRVANVLWFSSGFAIACLPSALLFLADPDSFWFNNMGYHMDRAGDGAARAQAERSRLIVGRVAFGLRQSARFEALEYPFLVYGAIAHLVIRLVRGSWPGLALAIGATLFAGCFLPVPTYVQYFIVTYPFFLVAAMQAFAPLWGRGVLARGAIIVLLAGFAFGRARTFPADVERYTSSGERVIGIAAGKARSWKLASVEEAGREIDRLNPGLEPVMALWPGHLVASRSPSLAAMENHFGVKYMEKMAPGTSFLERYKIRSWSEILSAIEKREPKLVVYFHSGRDSVPRKLAESGYRRAARIADISIWERGDSPASTDSRGS